MKIDITAAWVDYASQVAPGTVLQNNTGAVIYVSSTGQAADQAVIKIGSAIKYKSGALYFRSGQPAGAFLNVVPSNIELAGFSSGASAVPGATEATQIQVKDAINAVKGAVDLTTTSASDTKAAVDASKTALLSAISPLATNTTVTQVTSAVNALQGSGNKTLTDIATALSPLANGATEASLALARADLQTLITSLASNKTANTSENATLSTALGLLHTDMGTLGSKLDTLEATSALIKTAVDLVKTSTDAIAVAEAATTAAVDTARTAIVGAIGAVSKSSDIITLSAQLRGASLQTLTDVVTALAPLSNVAASTSATVTALGQTNTKLTTLLGNQSADNFDIKTLLGTIQSDVSQSHTDAQAALAEEQTQTALMQTNNATLLDILAADQAAPMTPAETKRLAKSVGALSEAPVNLNLKDSIKQGSLISLVRAFILAMRPRTLETKTDLYTVGAPRTYIHRGMTILAPSATDTFKINDVDIDMLYTSFIIPATANHKVKTVVECTSGTVKIIYTT